MKSERYFVTKLMAALRLAVRPSIVDKRADYATSGWPDIEILAPGGAAFVEVKFLRKGKRLKDIVKGLQIAMCSGVAAVCGGRCWIVVYEEDPAQTRIWTPEALAAALDGRFGAHPFTCQGWQYDFVARLVKESVECY